MNTAPTFHPFPLWNLPQIFRLTVDELYQNTMAPYPLIVGSVLSAASLACQRHVNVMRLDGQKGPCTLIITTIADSGERKSTIDSQTHRIFHKYDAEQLVKHEMALEGYKIEHRIWGTEHSALLKQLEKMTEKGLDTEVIKKKLITLAKREPKKPRLHKILYSNVTPEALAFSMHDNASSVGLVSAEAGGILSSSLTNNFALLNLLWDGSPVSVDRRTSESFTLKDARATISLMVQKKPFIDFLEKKGSDARGSGFFARSLIAFPCSTQGTRYRESATLSWEHLPNFHARIDELLTRQEQDEYDGVSPGRVVLKFSPEAQADMIEAYNHIERLINPGGFLSEAKDYASKAIENMIRLAAIFHFFSDQQGEISCKTFRSAEKIIYWYAEEFVRLFSSTDPLKEMNMDIQLLEQWLHKIHQSRGWNAIQKNFIRKFGPNSLRDKERLDWALNEMCAQGKIYYSISGRTKYVNLVFNRRYC